MNVSFTSPSRPRVYSAVLLKYSPKKLLKSETLSKAPLPEIRQGIKWMIESKMGSEL